MPKSLIFLILLLVVVAAPVVFLVATTPFGLESVELGRLADAQRLLSLVPGDAQDVAILPRAGAAIRAIQNHPVLRNAPEDDALASPFLPFLLGRSDVVLWRAENSRGAVARLDPVRAVLLRVYASTSGDRLNISSAWGASVVSSGTPSSPDASSRSQWLALAPSLRGHVFVIAAESSRAGFPPLARPALTALTFDGASIRTTSRAAHAKDVAVRDLSGARFPSSALIAAAVTECPRALKTIGKLFPFDICRLFANGGVIAIYDVDTRKLIPRLHGVIAVPAASAPSGLFDAALALEEHRNVGGVDIVRKRMPGATFEVARRGDEVLIGLDKSSLEKYLGDNLMTPPPASARAGWVVRVRPDELSRVLGALHERKELSLLAPDVERTVRDLRDSTSLFAGASSAVAVRTEDGGWDVVTGEVGAK